MFPLRDTVRSRTRPYVTWMLVALSVTAFLAMGSLQPGMFERLTVACGLVPARLELEDPAGWLTLVTSIFLHGGWFHLISNLWALYIFGDNI